MTEVELGSSCEGGAEAGLEHQQGGLKHQMPNLLTNHSMVYQLFSSEVQPQKMTII